MGGKARIWVFDIESAPSEVYVWGLRDQNISVDQVKHDQYMLMWAATEVGSGKVIHDSLIDHPSAFRDNRRDDRQIALSLRKMMDNADILVTQNGNSFDIPWAQQLFLKHGIERPSKFYSVDLLRESRRDYYSISHKLDFRGRQLAIGSKVPHEGFRLWLECMRGNKAAWSRMIEYCQGDVKLTERYYLKLRPRMKNHPNVNMFEKEKREPFTGRLKCPACASTNLSRNGFNYYACGKRQRFICACGYRMSLAGKADPKSGVVFRQE